eukprot:scaffold10009_cov105-Cylindrotheca_fusiformis.AAC.2
MAKRFLYLSVNSLAIQDKASSAEEIAGIFYSPSPMTDNSSVAIPYILPDDNVDFCKKNGRKLGQRLVQRGASIQQTKSMLPAADVRDGARTLQIWPNPGCAYPAIDDDDLTSKMVLVNRTWRFHSTKPASPSPIGRRLILQKQFPKTVLEPHLSSVRVTCQNSRELVLAVTDNCMRYILMERTMKGAHPAGNGPLGKNLLLGRAADVGAAEAD